MRDPGNPRSSGNTADERYREFAERNAEWERRIEETLTELDEPSEKPEPSESEATPA
jgi:hypothetical protein